MSSGREIIAKLVDFRNGVLVVEEPATIIFTQQGSQLVPSAVTVEGRGGKEIFMNPKQIELFGVTQEAARMQYIQAVTGIELPNKKILVG
jgi:hypothetical protein